ncbi:hypothetical protein G5V59_21110 [Nocardioides sp. W3-2-3]|nr:hypothetical protein [Nocardioides convexus]NHA01464.1 hypothetical protein [Nocardioides convexus]
MSTSRLHLRGDRRDRGPPARHRHPARQLGRRGSRLTGARSRSTPCPS